jgi:hypothetical protein
MLGKALMRPDIPVADLDIREAPPVESSMSVGVIQHVHTLTSTYCAGRTLHFSA